MTLTFTADQSKELQKLIDSKKIQSILLQRSTSRTGRIDKQKMLMALDTLEAEFDKKNTVDQTIQR
tara:strand:- start:600 stop:797 length:198 start_codon:yes stop_codon:yes gene_type:complete